MFTKRIRDAPYQCAHVENRRFYTEKKKPPYAILSHTWGGDEISFQAFCAGGQLSGEGHDKIVASCRLALEHQLSYVWIDTCCIDKTNSVELSEAINSMFRWYKESTICFALLSDLTGDTFDDFFACRGGLEDGRCRSG